MKELLFLSHRIPYPPNKGDKLRSFNLLKQLARDYRVHVGTFVDDRHDWRYVDEVKAIAGGESCFVRLTPWRAKLRSFPNLIGDDPLSLSYYFDETLRRWINKLLAERPIRHVLIYSGAMAQYVDGPAYGSLHRIVDFVDVDSDKWLQYAKSQSWPMNWVYRREARTLLAYERRIAAVMDASVFVSAGEATLFKQLAPETAERVWGIHNGVDTQYFDPAQSFPQPYAADHKAVVFTGAMDYWANVDAVSWFAREIFPRIRERDAAACFYIVGARPTAAVRELERLPGITVTGSVKDIRPYLAHAHVAVAPLRIARGVQNKVLEAMAMAKPVVASPQALEGILCEPGREVIKAEDAASFADKVHDVLQGNHEKLSHLARRRVLQDYSWEGNLRRFEALLETTETHGTGDVAALHASAGAGVQE